jgi:hypothetical protein
MEINMKNLLKLEELFMFGITIFLFARMDFSWWWYPALLFAPDLSMLGYLGGTQLGALTYNFVHHKALGVSVYIIGVLSVNPAVQLAGLILFGHSSMDRIWGYGLKYPDAFQHTHLGMIGKSA